MDTRGRGRGGRGQGAGGREQGAQGAGGALLSHAQCPIPNAQFLINVEVPNLLPHLATTEVLLGVELSGMGK